MSKKKWLIMALSLAFTCTGIAGLTACNKGENEPESSLSLPDSSVEEEIEEETEPNLAVSTKYVMLNVGDSYTVSAVASGTSAPVYAWAIDGGAAADVVMLTPNGNDKTVVTGLKAGETKLIVSTEIDGELYWETVVIYVNETNHVTVDIDNMERVEGGFALDLYTVENPDDDSVKTAITPDVKVYSRGEFVQDAKVEWQSTDTSVVAVKNGVFTSTGVSADEPTYVIGTYKQAGKTVRVLVAVTVRYTKIRLADKAVVEAEDLQDVYIERELLGNVQSVTLNGVEVGRYAPATRSIVFDKSKMPTDAALMGKDKEVVIATDLAEYVLPVDVYTMIIDTKEELDKMGDVAKACEKSGLLWNGYFVLGADIDYNGLYKSVAYSSPIFNCPERVNDWASGLDHGFAGLFDGDGHVIDGLQINEGTECGGFFGVLHAKGVIRNVAFTNASVSSNSGFICSAGAGKIESVYVQYKSIGAGPFHNQVRYSGTFFLQGVDVGASVDDCVVDVRGAEIVNISRVHAIGNSGAEYKRVYLIGGDTTVRSTAGISMTYTDLYEFAADKAVQMNIGKMNGDFWNTDSGVPLAKSVYENNFAVDGTEIPVDFDANTSAYVATEQPYKLTASRDFVKYTTAAEGVTIVGDTLRVSKDVAAGTKITVRASSMFDENVYSEREFSVLSLENEIDLTQDKTVYIDAKAGKADFGELTAEIDGADVLYYMDAQGNGVRLSDLPLGEGTLKGVTQDSVITFNYRAVTKILYTLDDLAAVRYLGKDVEGTYVLGGNIDGQGAKLAATGGETYLQVGFKGTLDGRGYTVSNISIDGYGLFGMMSGATVKNINFENVSAGGSLFAYNAFSCTFENIEITFADCALNYGFLIGSYAPNCHFKDITIDATAFTKQIKAAWGVAWGQEGAKPSPTFENVTIYAKDIKYWALNSWTDDKGYAEWPTEGVTLAQK